MSTISTHVLDTATGKPAQGVPVRLEARTAEGFELLGEGVTDADGRHRALLPAGTTLTLGVYRMTFDTSAYFAATGTRGFYPEVQVVFEVLDERHHHVPLLLSPFGFSTYRGS